MSCARPASTGRVYGCRSGAEGMGLDGEAGSRAARERRKWKNAVQE